MRFPFFVYMPLIFLCRAPLNWCQHTGEQSAPPVGDRSSSSISSPVRVPRGVILVKGAWSSASDAVMPLPEGGKISNGVFSNPYFGIRYNPPPGWSQKYEGPPPSDTGHYVLALLSPGSAVKTRGVASILFAAQDMFFTPLPVSGTMEFMNSMKETLRKDYRIEAAPTETIIDGRTFAFFAYWSPAAGLHWYVLATQARCHLVQIVLTGSDPSLLKSLLKDLNSMKFPPETQSTAGSDAPVCVKNYGRDENIAMKINPVLTDYKFNSIPVRIIIDKEGRVKHIHFISAFDDQAKAIAEALGKWRFKAHDENGRPSEVETGILFGRETASRTRWPPN